MGRMISMPVSELQKRADKKNNQE